MCYISPFFYIFFFFFFFFQAEDGIRDDLVTGVQTCALPICDLSLAARIQRRLLPEPGLAPAGWDVHYHYQPAAMVSGDYCDLFQTDGGMLFMLGDVSGKHVPPSMLLSHLHPTCRSLP